MNDLDACGVFLREPASPVLIQYCQYLLYLRTSHANDAKARSGIKKFHLKRMHRAPSSQVTVPLVDASLDQPQHRAVGTERKEVGGNAPVFAIVAAIQRDDGTLPPRATRISQSSRPHHHIPIFKPHHTTFLVAVDASQANVDLERAKT